MSNRVRIDLERSLAPIDKAIFGGFAEHLGRCIYGGIYDPDSPHADEHGFRRDVLGALQRLRMPVVRYPGGNFVSGYRWQDGVGPKGERPLRMDLAWHDLEPNTFGTNEFIDFCRAVGTEPYLVVNCGDGDMREARDWLEYCNGVKDTSLVKLRKRHGYERPHKVKYWGIGNEVDGPWQIGFKTPEEYARAYTEYAKVMKWTDPTIQLLASAVSLWNEDFVERTQLLVEQAGKLIDYLAIHWYAGNDSKRGYRDDHFESYMSHSEIFEERLSAYAGLIRSLCYAQKITKPIPIAVDEWNVWYRAYGEEKLEEIYNLEDALVVASHLNAFIRHARNVKMANLAQIVNVIAPIYTRGDDMVLQTIYYPFELYSTTCGDTALDVHWSGDTFSTPEHSGVRVLDVSATLDTDGKKLAVYLINRTEHKETDTCIELTGARFAGSAKAYVINGPHIKAENTFASPDQVGVREETVRAEGQEFTLPLEAHSVTALVFDIS
ncbi:MAG: alpha-N-arabinofuranosidase [Deinococcota bacterium]|nr:alpha-N-arabinofuranosidase [Deinococcota bacterium]